MSEMAEDTSDDGNSMFRVSFDPPTVNLGCVDHYEVSYCASTLVSLITGCIASLTETAVLYRSRSYMGVMIKDPAMRELFESRVATSAVTTKLNIEETSKEIGELTTCFTCILSFALGAFTG